MSILLAQTRAATLSALKGLPQRLGLAASMALSIALVVLVLSGFLALAAGFEKALSEGSASDLAVVIGGAREETASSLPADAISALTASLPRKRAISRETVLSVELPEAKADSQEAVALRGMDPAGPVLRAATIRLEGRSFASGARELVVGAGLAARHPALKPGQVLRLGPVDWTVTGLFHAENKVMEQEIWTDLSDLQAAFDRPGEVKSLRLRFDGTQDFEALEKLVSGVTQARLSVLREADLHAGEAAGRARLIRLFGWPLALIMAAGAAAGALNSIASSVLSRRTEIATFRLIGFSRRSLVCAVMAEAMALSLVGTAFGLAVALAAFQGLEAGTLGRRAGA